MKNPSNMILAVVLVLCAGMISGCGEDPSSTSKPTPSAPAQAEKLAVSCGIAPAAWIVREIGGDKVDVTSLLPDGKNVHDYEPGIAEVRSLKKSAVFFHFDLPFESRVSRVLGGSVADVALADVCRKIPMQFECDHDHDHDHEAKDAEDKEHEHGGDQSDPHVWLGMDNLIRIAGKIAEVLIARDPANRAYYQERLAAFERRANQLRDGGREALGGKKNRNFYVHHPAFGYFAKEQNLKQCAVELGGKDPSPRHLAELVRQMRAEKVETILVQPSMNPATARTLGDNGRCRMVTVDPLGGDVFHTYGHLTDVLSKEAR
ncbi:MAG: zinc ABC transporter substrate-binding protein [Victivallaceae bacterium]|nr:zinc ABC transporter substrate-binding protein [Victivallaceae bacterium]